MHYRDKAINRANLERWRVVAALGRFAAGHIIARCRVVSRTTYTASWRLSQAALLPAPLLTLGSLPTHGHCASPLPVSGPAPMQDPAECRLDTAMDTWVNLIAAQPMPKDLQTRSFARGCMLATGRSGRDRLTLK